MMELQNEVLDVWARRREALSPAQWRELLSTMTLLLSPMAPHLAEEVWQLSGHDESVLDAPWPVWDEALAADEVVTVVVQVNGKLRDRLRGAGGRREGRRAGVTPARPRTRRASWRASRSSKRSTCPASS